VVALVSGLGLLVALLALGAWALSTEMALSSSPRALLALLPGAGGTLALLLLGSLAVNLLWTGWDLLGRRHHAWRQDAFAGQSSLWLSLLAPALVVDHQAGALVVLIGGVATATVAAAVLTCRGGARRRNGLVVAAGVGAALWFGPVLWVLWASDASLPTRVAGTLVLAVGMAVPVLAVTAMPATCGGVVLRGWALGAVLALALGWGVLDSMSSPVTLPIPIFVSTACAVIVAVVVSGMLGKGEKRTAAVGGPGRPGGAG
jgi:hypothetical protein